MCAGCRGLTACFVYTPVHTIHCALHPQAVFTLLLGPFTFFDVQKTKYLQILTSLMRWIGESETPPPPPLPGLCREARQTLFSLPDWSFDLSRGQGEGKCSVGLLLLGKFSTKKM